MPGTTTHTLDVNINLEAEFLSDILITAFDSNYGGCWYWSEPSQPADADSWLTFRRTHPDANLGTTEWLAVSILETGDGDRSIHHTVDWTVIARGLQRVLDAHTSGEHHPAWVPAILSGDAGNLDADAADVIVQYGLFDEVRYG